MDMFIKNVLREPHQIWHRDGECVVLAVALLRQQQEVCEVSRSICTALNQTYSLNGALCLQQAHHPQHEPSSSKESNRENTDSFKWTIHFLQRTFQSQAIIERFIHFQKPISTHALQFCASRFTAQSIRTSKRCKKVYCEFLAKTDGSRTAMLMENHCQHVYPIQGKDTREGEREESGSNRAYGNNRMT